MEKQFDYLILGGGSAGCVLAARLSEDPALQVALVESGGEGRDWVIRTPFAAVTMLPTRLNNYAYETVPQAGFDGRRGYQPRGRCLGGSSAINAMVYIRGDRWDYDHWASLGNPGWSYNDVLPYFKRAEHNERIRDGYHGQGGPLNVADRRTDNPFPQRFIEAARAAGLPLNDDFNGATMEGAGLYQLTQVKGERCSVARAYLHPLLGSANARPNLTVLTGTQAEQILFEGRDAVGARVRRAGETLTLKARGEVIVAGGAFGSPQLLMLSGIGDPQQLAEQQIPLVHALKGVGANLQDHPDFIFGYAVDSTDLVGFTPAGGWRLLREFLRYRRNRRGMITTNYAEAGGFFRLHADSPAPDVQLHFVIALVDDHARKLNYRHGLSCHVCLLRPKSRGSVRLASRDPRAAPLIDPAFFAHPDDLEELLAGYRLTERILATPPLATHFRRNLFSQGVSSDDEARAVIRRRADTVYHPSGTCRMGTGDDAVVDAELRVHGMGRLRVVDASIMPTLIGGNTNAPTVMIAEKAADLIRRASGQGR